MDMLSFKVTEVPRPKELAQFEHRPIIWMMFKAYMETLLWSGWNTFANQGYLHLALSTMQGSRANLHLGQTE